MQTVQPSLIARDDTLLGVCEALGQDLGFNPLYLRVVFAGLLLWNPIVVLGTYAALGVIVLGSRLLFPAKTRPQAEVAPAAPVQAEEPEAEEVELAEAA